MIRILIADDHAILRVGLRQILSECGDIQVAGESSNGAEALAPLRAEPFDALVTDMTMPGRSGIELIKQIKGERPKLPVLILSMHKEDVYAVRALRAGASGYLCKDNAETQLAEAIRKVAGGGLFISPAVTEKLALGLLAGRAGEAPPHTRLSDREYQIFQLLAAGHAVTDIAHRLNLSVKTVSTHKTRILEKMGLANTADLVRYAVRHELIVEGDELAG